MGPPAEIADVVIAAAHDRTALAVFADWLQQQGDPRGELVAMALHGDPELEPRVRKLTHELDPSLPVRWVTWADGFPRRVIIDADALEHLPLLLQSSACWGLTELVAVETPLDRLVALLVEHASNLPVLSSLQLRSGARGDPRIDIEPVVARLPRLARLRVDVPHAPFRLASDLTELSVALDGEQRPAWADRSHPALASLRLRSWAPLHAMPWLAPERFPRLRHLALIARGPSAVPSGFALARCERIVCDAPGFATAWQIDEPADAVRTGEAALIAIGGDAVTSGTVSPMRGETFWIGQIHGGYPDLHIGSRWISRRHTRLARGTDWTVADGESMTGTWLDNVRLGHQRVPLRDGAELQCGRTFFRFVQGDAARSHDSVAGNDHDRSRCSPRPSG